MIRLVGKRLNDETTRATERLENSIRDDRELDFDNAIEDLAAIQQRMTRAIRDGNSEYVFPEDIETAEEYRQLRSTNILDAAVNNGIDHRDEYELNHPEQEDPDNHRLAQLNGYIKFAVDLIPSDQELFITKMAAEFAIAAADDSEDDQDHLSEIYGSLIRGSLIAVAAAAL